MGKKTKTHSRRKNPLLLISIICFGILACYLFLYHDSNYSPQVNTQYSKTILEVKPNTAVVKSKNTDQKKIPQKADILTKGDKISNEETIFDALQKQYGKYIHETDEQIAVIEELIQYLMKIYPGDWESHFSEFVQLAFPQYALELIDKFNKLRGYKEWLANNTDIRLLPREERNKLLWEQRRGIFGDNADEIWAKEIKIEKLYHNLEEINNTPDSNLDEKLTIYQDSILDIFQEERQQTLQKMNYKFVSAFLNLDSIQADLQQMNKEERYQNLTNVRRAMEISEDGIERLTQLDIIRDQRWVNGILYMKEREQVIQNYPDNETKIKALQQTYFGEVAEVIAAEESSGFYRFKSKRVYGRN